MRSYYYIQPSAIRQLLFTGCSCLYVLHIGAVITVFLHSLTLHNPARLRAALFAILRYAVIINLKRRGTIWLALK